MAAACHQIPAGTCHSHTGFGGVSPPKALSFQPGPRAGASNGEGALGLGRSVTVGPGQGPH